MKTLFNLTIISLLSGLTNVSHANNEFVDPTRPANYIEEPIAIATGVSTGESKGVEPVSEFKLNAIKIGQGLRLAIINGETVYPGQTIGNGRLLRINESSVVMDVQGKAMTVSFLPDPIKKLPKK